jgi:hypothetical protein
MSELCGVCSHINTRSPLSCAFFCSENGSSGKAGVKDCAPQDDCNQQWGAQLQGNCGQPATIAVFELCFGMQWQ